MTACFGICYRCNHEMQCADYNKDDNLLSENIYNAMKLYMTDNSLYMTHKANTKLLYKQFNPELWGSRYVDFYQAVHTGLKK